MYPEESLHNELFFPLIFRLSTSGRTRTFFGTLNMSGRVKTPDKYLSLQRRLQRERKLFEDKDFAPSDKALFTRTRLPVNLIWKRPGVTHIN